MPLPAMSTGQRLRDGGHWLWESQRGKGGTSGGFYVGDKVLASVPDTGLVTGWLVGKAFLSARAGQPQLVGPAPATHASRAERPSPPVGHMGRGKRWATRTGGPTWRTRASIPAAGDSIGRSPMRRRSSAFLRRVIPNAPPGHVLTAAG